MPAKPVGLWDLNLATPPAKFCGWGLVAGRLPAFVSEFDQADTMQRSRSPGSEQRRSGKPATSYGVRRKRARVATQGV